MNNTKTSRLSIKSIKPSNFRVFLKQRSNHHEPTKPMPQNQALNQTVKSLNNQKSIALKTENLTQMKEYVRNRIKTEQQLPTTQFQHNSKQNSKDDEQQFRKTFVNQLKSTNQKPKIKSFLSDFNVEQSKGQSSNRVSEKQKISTLKALQERVEGLLLQKLHHCNAYKNGFNNQLEQELRSLINHIKQLQQTNPENNSCTVSLINSKILMFQKLMAQNMAQAEIMKKYLLSRISNQSKIRRLKTESFANQSHQYSYRDIDVCKQAIVNTSYHQDSFRTPEKRAYDIYKHKQEHFNAGRDRQPLPRSSYNREYLIYDQVQESEILPINNVILSRSSSANMFNSSYRDSFGPKRTSRVNIKELDAFKNKIKNIPIDFSRRIKSYTNMSHYDLTRDRSTKTKRYQQPLKMPGKYLLTQSKRQFTNDAYNHSKVSIKHENLQKLRYQYKNIVHT